MEPPAKTVGSASTTSVHWDRDLAEAIIADHNARPRGYHAMPAATHEAQGYDPFCGDRYTVQLRLEDGIVREAAFQGFGCSISKSSASMLTGMVTGLPVDRALNLATQVEDAFLSRNDAHVPAGDLKALSVVREQPSRIKCVLLPWRALKAALAR